MDITPLSGESSVEELETLLAGTEPRTSHHRSHGGERLGQRERKKKKKKKRRKKHARLSSLKGRERIFVNQTNIGTVSKATLGKVPRDGVERIWAFPSG